MSEKQAIEVGQVWGMSTTGDTVEVVGISPAWVTVKTDGETVMSVRKGHLRDYWTLMTKEPEPIELEDTRADNTSTHAAMQAAVAAFNAMTGKRLDESDGWLLTMFYALQMQRNGLDQEQEVLELYQESREVD